MHTKFEIIGHTLRFFDRGLSVLNSPNDSERKEALEAVRKLAAGVDVASGDGIKITESQDWMNWIHSNTAILKSGDEGVIPYDLKVMLGYVLWHSYMELNQDRRMRLADWGNPVNEPLLFELQTDLAEALHQNGGSPWARNMASRLESAMGI